MKIIKLNQKQPLKANPQVIQQQQPMQQNQQVQPTQQIPQQVPQQIPQQAVPQQVQPQQNTLKQTKLTPEENTILTQINNNLKRVAPELGDIMQNPRNRAIVFKVLDAMGNLNPANIKNILKKIESV